jgi:hypothetical protein
MIDMVNVETYSYDDSEEVDLLRRLKEDFEAEP